MATRRERVVLDLEDHFSAGMAKAAMSAALLNKELNSLSGSAVRGASRDIEQVGRSSESSGKQIDKLSGRLALFAQAAAALGPALAPIGAAVVPAIAGMTLQLGLAAGAAGVTVLAFKGVGDGLKALNAYQLEPTKENFAKLQEAMDALGPAGGEFVLSLDKMTPKFEKLQNLAARGLLPGATEGLNEMMALMPQAQAVVSTFATTIGDLMASAGDNLNDPAWVRFFDYINVTARPVLTEMGQTLGNFVEGLANMVRAFDPLSRSFSTGFLDMSRAFNEWSQNLSGSQGFQEFVDYVQNSGPLAMDALGSIANAIIQLVEAAAPVGTAVLPVITALADAFSAVADSAVGPALIATAAAVSVLSRSMALLGASSKGLTGGGIAGAVGAPEKLKAVSSSIREVAAATTELQIAEMQRARSAKSAAAAQSGLLPVGDKRGAVTEYMAASERAAKASERLAEAEKKRSAAVRAGAAQFGKTAGLVGGLALATSGLADKTGLANATSLALMGTIAGPWGSAVGGGVGLVMDLAGANNDLEDAMKAVDQAFSSSVPNFTEQAAVLDNLRTKSEESGNTFRDAWSWSGDASIGNSIKGLTSISDLWTHSTEKNTEAARKHRDEMMAMGTTLTALSAKTGGDLPFGASVEQLTSYAIKIAPALQAAGLSFKDIKGNSALAERAIHDYAMSMDTASGKSKTVAAALAALGGELETNATQADALKSAMDSLFGVQISQSQATDEWTDQLHRLRGEIGKTNGEVEGNSVAALKNRQQIRESVKALEEKVSADAAAGVSGDKLVGSLIRGRDAIIEQATAAGASRGKVDAYLKTLGMTPKNLTTIIEASGVLTAKQKMEALAKVYGLTPRQVKTLVSEAGVAPTRAKVEALMKKYDLTRRQVLTLIKADASQALATIARVNYARIADKSFTITTYYDAVRRDANTANFAPPPGSSPTRRDAAGGAIYGPGTGTSDSIPAWLSNGEYVIKAAAVDKYGTHMFDRLNAMAFADGGSVSRKPETPSETKARLEKAKNHRRGSLGQFDLVGGMSIKELRDEFRGLREDFHSGRGAFRGLQNQAERVSLAYLKHSKALEASKKVLEGLRSDKAQYASSVTGAFSHDPFGNGIAGLKLQLEADRNDARAAMGFSKTLDGKRVNQGLQKALLASGDLNTLSQLAALSKADLGQYNTLYQQTASATGGLGRYAAGDQFNAAIAKAGATNARLVKAMAANTAAINKIEHRVEAGTRSGAEAGTRRGMADRAKETTQRRKVKR